MGSTSHGLWSMNVGFDSVFQGSLLHRWPMLNQSVRLCNSQNGRQHKGFQTIYLQECQNGLATNAINGYFKAFAACKLLEKSEKNGRLKKFLNTKRKRNCFNHTLHVLSCEAPSLPSLVVCVPLPGKHISLVICVSLTWEKHIPSDMCSPTRVTNIPIGMSSPT